jgi:hypothetical protein
MAQRWWFAAIIVTAALMAGCSGGKSTTSAPSTTQSGTKSNADLLAANDKDAARKAADTLEKYNPPAKVKDAIEHFVTTGGAHFDDPDYTKNNKLVSDWVKQVCPT